ncbi:MAG: type II toxin-antitoxin system VapC family toxin [Deltaproteobacteria bacterium]|nr:type II toxin-antitoxin system VapC family toxin [Deltaproteobacteria bacterium]
MILQPDTSALIKLYVEEAHSDAVKAGTEGAEAVASSAVAHAEARATLGRLRRENRLSDAGLTEAKTSFERDWPAFLRVQTDEALLRRAGDLAELLALRGYDGVHLAAAELARTRSDTPVIFACFDNALNRAPRALGFDLLPMNGT